MLRCQETLGELHSHPDGLYSPLADRVYPIRDGIVFMGYPRDDQEFVLRVMDEEREHQTSERYFERDFEFLRSSSVAVLAMMSMMNRNQIRLSGTRVLELGAGSGWVSWMFAQAGCRVSLCDLEPNGLTTGLVYEHANLCDRVACDARYAPFADDSFDIVICKELAHHISDKRLLFNEACRVLRLGGWLVTLDPVKSVNSTVREVFRPDSHFGHSLGWPSDYVRAATRSGFAVAELACYQSRATGRFGVTRRYRARGCTALAQGMPSCDRSMRTFTLLFGGQLMMAARKEHRVSPVSRPSMCVIDPGVVTVSERDIARYRPFAEFLGELEIPRAS